MAPENSSSPLAEAPLPDSYDVFLSHNSRDKPVVREVDKLLRREGIRTWLDEKDILPGDVWEDELEVILGSIPVAVIFIGEHGMGRWERPETRVLLDEQAKRGVRLIPVLLPGAKEVSEHRFLGQFSWTDLRDGIAEEKLQRLVAGIRKGLARDSRGSELPGRS